MAPKGKLCAIKHICFANYNPSCIFIKGSGMSASEFSVNVETQNSRTDIGLLISDTLHIKVCSSGLKKPKKIALSY